MHTDYCYEYECLWQQKITKTINTKTKQEESKRLLKYWKAITMNLGFFSCAPVDEKKSYYILG